MLLGVALPCLAIALLALGYVAGWHEGYRQAWLVMVPKPPKVRERPDAMLVQCRRPLSPDFVASLKRVMAEQERKRNAN